MGPPWTLGPWFEQTWQKTTKQCYILNFKHLGQVVLKKKIFEYISVHFYGLNLEPLARGHLGPWDLGLNKLGKDHKAMLHIKFKHMSQAVLEKKIFKYISFLNTRPPSQGHFGSQGHHLNILGRDPLGNATYQILRLQV